MLQVKSLPRILLAVYLLFLLWLILFKTSVDVSSVLLGYQSRSLNLLPFAGFSRGTVREMFDNLVVFIPLGLLLDINFRQITFWRKLGFVLSLSLVAEVTQYILAIGTTDITDVIMNTFGGLLGLGLYHFSSKWIDTRKLNWFIGITLTILLVLFLILRFFVLRVRY
ncbi:MAG TPA: VanZ family protein [Candidatus Saccharimonadales bacterium]|nr:VanZ family protein [Candidatus Saccharimonadales bacterium]